MRTLHSLKSTRKSHIRPCANDIVHARFEDVRNHLYVFLSLVKASVRYELWVNVAVAIFFPTEDYQTLWSFIQILPMMLTKTSDARI